LEAEDPPPLTARGFRLIDSWNQEIVEETYDHSPMWYGIPFEFILEPGTIEKVLQVRIPYSISSVREYDRYRCRVDLQLRGLKTGELHILTIWRNTFLNDLKTNFILSEAGTIDGEILYPESLKFQQTAATIHYTFMSHSLEDVEGSHYVFTLGPCSLYGE
jgi:hypothetical protein